MPNRDTIKSEIDELVKIGNGIFENWKDKKLTPDIQEYQVWYTKSLRTIQTLLPKRLEEFKSYYEPQEIKHLNILTYKISYFLRGAIPVSKFDHIESARLSLNMQIGILRSIHDNIDSILFNLEDSILYEYESDELAAAYKIFLINIRAAGALAGVIIEKHLKKIILHNQLSLKKSNPGINDLAQALKDNGVIDTPIWRKIGYMADIRNYCDHKKEREPKEEEVQTLLDDTNWLISNIN